MWQIAVFFIGIILLLVGLFLFSAAMTTVDPVSASQKKTWSFVVIIIGFFLLFLAAACQHHHHWMANVNMPGGMGMKYY